MISLFTVASPGPALGFALPVRRTAWRLLALTFSLVTDATVGNRLLAIQLFPTGFSATPIQIGDGTPVTANLSVIVSYYCGAPGFKTPVANGVESAPLPDNGLYVGPDWIAQVAGQFSGPADQISKIIAMIDDLDQRE